MFFRPDPAPADSTDQTREEAARERLMTGLLAMREVLAPAFDAADGMRADLVNRGWSPQSAEVIALTWLQRIVTHAPPLIGGPK